MEDKIENRLLLRTLLEKVGLFVIEAENGAEGVRLFSQEQPDFIWMDLRMPIMDGYECTRQIRQLPGGDRIPIVAVTASAFSDDETKVVEAGCNDFIHKPYREYEIFRTMEKHWDISFLYETAPDNAQTPEVTPQALRRVPEALRNTLLGALKDMDMAQVSQVLEKMEREYPEVAGPLKKWVENYEYDRLETLLKGVNDG